MAIGLEDQPQVFRVRKAKVVSARPTLDLGVWQRGYTKCDECQHCGFQPSVGYGPMGYKETKLIGFHGPLPVPYPLNVVKTIQCQAFRVRGEGGLRLYWGK